MLMAQLGTKAISWQDSLVRFEDFWNRKNVSSGLQSPFMQGWEMLQGFVEFKLDKFEVNW